MNNTDNSYAEIRNETVRHAMALEQIAHKYNRKVIELFIGDCITSTATLIEMGYGETLVEKLDQVKERHNIR